MPRFIDLTGQEINGFKVICRARSDKAGNSRWMCRCVRCGHHKAILSPHLKNGTPKCQCEGVAGIVINEPSCLAGMSHHWHRASFYTTETGNRIREEVCCQCGMRRFTLMEIRNEQSKCGAYSPDVYESVGEYEYIKVGDGER